MPIQRFNLNGKSTEVDVPDDLAMLWTLRDKLGVNGPKYGCGINVCKACTSLVDGLAFNPCQVDTSEFEGRDVVTIEGLAKDGKLHPVQQAWLEMDVPQCGYCQPGQIMSAVALLNKVADPTDADIDQIENVCRCGTYGRIRGAIKRSVQLMLEQGMTPGTPSQPVTDTGSTTGTGTTTGTDS